MFWLFIMVFKLWNVFSLFFRLLLSFSLGFNFRFDFSFYLWFYLSFNFCLNDWFFFGSLLLGLSLSFFTFGSFTSRLSGLIFIVMWLIGSSELSRHGSNAGPILDGLFLLSSHFDEESSVEDFLIVVISDEVDSVNFHFEDDFE